MMKKLMTLAMMLLITITLVGCKASANQENNTERVNETGSGDEISGNENNSDNDEDINQNNILIVYFSRTGENYDVGVIDKGNTAIVADIIAEETGADEFEIVPVNAYPDSYDEMLKVAKKEVSENALPEYLGEVENWDNYDTVFIGYPIWWGDMPRIVYTFLENHNWTGKTVIPFDTNAGSGLAGTESSINDITKTTVLNGLAIKGTDAQNNQDSVRKSVKSWIEELEI